MSLVVIYQLKNLGVFQFVKKLECSRISKFLSFKMTWSSPFIKIIQVAKFCTKVPYRFYKKRLIIFLTNRQTGKASISPSISKRRFCLFFSFSRNKSKILFFSVFSRFYFQPMKMAFSDFCWFWVIKISQSARSPRFSEKVFFSLFFFLWFEILFFENFRVRDAF